jgi:hypothetical protein
MLLLAARAARLFAPGSLTVAFTLFAAGSSQAVAKSENPMIAEAKYFIFCLLKVFELFKFGLS